MKKTLKSIKKTSKKKAIGTNKETKLSAILKSNKTRKLIKQDLKKVISNKKTFQQISFPIVGIGASAGGMDAFTQLLENLPTQSGMAFVLIQHLSPNFKSVLSDILSKKTKIQIQEIKNGMKIESNNIYVIPPNKNMFLSGDKLMLTPRVAQHSQHLPIDCFFTSLAQQQKNQAIGIILSGTGSDGTSGLKAIKAEGGITFAQILESAEYDEMPSSAIAAGCVDFIMNPKNIAKELLRISKHPYVSNSSLSDEKDFLELNDTNLNIIFNLVKSSSGVDFNLYKHSTIKRRISRRIILNKMRSSTDYIDYLKNTPAEINILFNDLLINVTEFFRDPNIYKTLKEKVFPTILKNKNPDNPIRIWIPGCSTGEEAYSIAISLTEFLNSKADPTPIQIFASDLSKKTIDTARTGFYSKNAISGISQERLRHFFIKVEGGYKINKIIRDKCIFATQNIIKDPPFSNIDLISCRNLLIYLGSPLQDKIIQTFQYALKPTGFLLLGSAETIGRFSRFFSIIDKKNKIFAKNTALTKPLANINQQIPKKVKSDTRMEKATSNKTHEIFNVEKNADQLILNKYAPSGVLINNQLEVLQFRGYTGPFLEPSPGKATLNILKLVRQGLSYELQKAIHLAEITETFVRKDGIKIVSHEQIKTVNIIVIPIKNPNEVHDIYFLILFENALIQIDTEENAENLNLIKSLPINKNIKKKEKEIIILKKEIASTKEYMQSIIETQETTNEELKSANEEIQSSNEELQSTNEELETSKEELQSTNEELTTLNDELNNRNSELNLLTNDILNILNSISFPIVMVNRSLCIRRTTPEAAKILNITESDIGRSINDIKIRIDIPNLNKIIKNVIDTFHKFETEISDKKGNAYLLQIKPYQTMDNKIDGAVLVFIDINPLKKALDEVKESHLYSESIVDTMREAFLVLDKNLKVIKANRSFYKIFNVTQDNTENHFIYELGNQQWNIPKLKHLLEEILPKKKILENFKVEHTFTDIGHKIMLINARTIKRKAEENLILVGIEDITETTLSRSNIEHMSRFPSENPAPVMRISKDNTILYANAPSNDILNNWDTCVGKKTPDFLSTLCKDALILNKNYEFEIVILEKIFLFTLVPVKKFGYINCYGFDITKRKKAEQKRIEDISSLAAIVAHELRNPLGVIKSANYIINKKTVETSLKKHTQIIEKKISECEKIINNLLSYSCRKTPDYEKVNIKKVLKECIDQCKEKYFDWNINVLQKRQNGEKEIIIDADKDQILEVFLNLLDNAYQAFPDKKGKITINVLQPDNKGIVRIAIEDNGCGIAKKDLKNVFEPFFTKKSKGVGLGLTVCSQLINFHNGKLEIVSAPGKGTKITVSLPVKKK